MVLPIPFQGVLKCLYFVPEKTLAMTDVRKLMSSSMAKKMEKVERFVGEAEKICSINQVAPNVQLQKLGVLSCHLTLCALEKKHGPSLRTWRKQGVKFIDLLRELSGNANITCPWSMAPSTSAGISAKAAKSEKKTEFVGNA